MQEGEEEGAKAEGADGGERFDVGFAVGGLGLARDAEGGEDGVAWR